MLAKTGLCSWNAFNVWFDIQCWYALSDNKKKSVTKLFGGDDESFCPSKIYDLNYAD